MDTPKTPDTLSATLSSWRVAPSRNPQFRHEVWARIGAEADSLPWSVFARRHLAMVGGALALALVVGAISGHEQARSRVASESDRLAAAYVQGLDARTMQMP